MNINDQLIDAAKTGDLVEINRLLDSGATPWGIHWALAWAAANGHQIVVERMEQHLASLGG